MRPPRVRATLSEALSAELSGDMVYSGQRERLNDTTRRQSVEKVGVPCVLS